MNNRCHRIKNKVLRDMEQDFKDCYDYRKQPHDIRIGILDEYHSNVLPFVEDAITFTLNAFEKELEKQKK